MRRALLAPVIAAACSHPRASAPGGGGGAPSIDRFSATAAHIFVRTADNGLPAAGAPIDLDRPPFVTEGLGPDGSHVRYYSFDVQPDAPATLYRFTRAGERAPIAGALDVVDAVPGDPGYSDFRRIAWV